MAFIEMMPIIKSPLQIVLRNTLEWNKEGKGTYLRTSQFSYYILEFTPTPISFACLSLFRFSLSSVCSCFLVSFSCSSGEEDLFAFSLKDLFPVAALHKALTLIKRDLNAGVAGTNRQGGQNKMWGLNRYLLPHTRGNLPDISTPNSRARK